MNQANHCKDLFDLDWIEALAVLGGQIRSLQEENVRLQRLIGAMAERIAGQSELLSRRAEKENS